MKSLIAMIAVAFMATAGGASAESGTASFYWKGQRTASGEAFNRHDMTAAHPSHPFGTMLLVRHRNKSVVVRVNDRGPYVRGRIIDLSLAAAKALGLAQRGVGHVNVQLWRKHDVARSN